MVPFKNAYLKKIYFCICNNTKKTLKIYHSRIPNTDLCFVEGLRFPGKQSHKFISFLFSRDICEITERKNDNIQTCFHYLKISYKKTE